MAKPLEEMICLGRGYPHYLIDCNRLKVDVVPGSGILVIKRACRATVSCLKKEEVFTQRTTFRVGSFLNPHWQFLARESQTAQFFLARKNHPRWPARIESYGTGYRVAIYQMVEDLNHLIRLQVHTEETYFGLSTSLTGMPGEWARLQAALDCLEEAFLALTLWKEKDEQARWQIVSQLLKQAIVLEKAVVPQKLEAAKRFSLGLSDSLGRINILIASLRLKKAERFLTNRAHEQIPSITAVIASRQTAAEIYRRNLIAIIKRLKNSLISICAQLERDLANSKMPFKRNITALEIRAKAIETTLSVRPIRFRAQQAARRLEYAARCLRNQQLPRAIKVITLADKILIWPET